MILGFRHKGLARFWAEGSLAGIRAEHAPRLARQLRQLNDSKGSPGMNVPGWKLHPLKGRETGRWSVWLSGNWRLTFAFRGADAVDVDLEDYH